MRTRLLTIPILVALEVAMAPVAAQQATSPRAETSSPTTTSSMDEAAKRHVIDAAIAKMTEGYVFPSKVKGIAKALHGGLAGKYRAVSNPQAFVDAVNVDIETVAKDRHLRLFWSSEPLPPLADPENIDPALLKKQSEFMARRNFAIRHVQVLDGNIGYLKINGFLPPEVAGATLAAAMGFLKNTDALIIDLRDNGGGDPSGVAMLVSYLEPPETLINTFHRRDKSVDDQIWSLAYVPGGRWSTDKPVYVLTSKDTASGAEEFAYDMQQLKRGTVVGASTWGGANPGKMVPIDAHFAIFVPFGTAVNPISKTNWEGVGVKPDVVVSPADALTTAQGLALKKLIDGATGQRRAELQRFLDAQSTR